MKYLFVLALVALTGVTALETAWDSGLRFAQQNPNNEVNSLMNKAPDAANNQCGNCPQADPMEPEEDPAVAEFKEEVKNLDQEIADLKAAIEKGKACADQVEKDEARLKYLLEQENKVGKDEEEEELRSELETQEMSLNQVDKMAGSLRSKFMALRRAQNQIRSKMSGTKASLNAMETMDAEAEPAAENTGAEEAAYTDLNADVAAIHKAIIDSISESNGKVAGMVKETGLKGHKIGEDADGDGARFAEINLEEAAKTVRELKKVKKQIEAAKRRHH